MPAETSPVNAPAACALTSCAPHAIAELVSAACACPRYGYGTQTAIARRSDGSHSDTRRSSRRAFVASAPFIFQLPTTSFGRIHHHPRRLPVRRNGANPAQTSISACYRQNLRILPRRVIVGQRDVWSRSGTAFYSPLTGRNPLKMPVTNIDATASTPALSGTFSGIGAAVAVAA